MNVDGDMVEYVYADPRETLGEALDYFTRQLLADSSIESATRRLYWELHEGIGYQDNKQDTFNGDCDAVREWIGNLSFAYYAVTAIDLETDDVLWTNEERIYASDHKAAIVGKEVAHYV